MLRSGGKHSNLNAVESDTSCNALALLQEVSVGGLGKSTELQNRPYEGDNQYWPLAELTFCMAIPKAIC